MSNGDQALPGKTLITLLNKAGGAGRESSFIYHRAKRGPALSVATRAMVGLPRAATACPLFRVFLARHAVNMNRASKHGGACELIRQTTTAHQPPLWIAYA